MFSSCLLSQLELFYLPSSLLSFPRNMIAANVAGAAARGSGDCNERRQTLTNAVLFSKQAYLRRSKHHSANNANQRTGSFVSSISLLEFQMSLIYSHGVGGARYEGRGERNTGEGCGRRMWGRTGGGDQRTRYHRVIIGFYDSSLRESGESLRWVGKSDFFNKQLDIASKAPN